VRYLRFGPLERLSTLVLTFSNKMGFFGGIMIWHSFRPTYANCIPISHPRASCVVFSDTFRQWKWPEPVMLTKPYTTNLGYRARDRT